MSSGVSPAAPGTRSALLLQAAVTLLFGLLRSGTGSAWGLATVVIAVVAVGLAAALQATPAFRSAVLAYEVLALAFGAFGAASGHYVPGTVIGLVLLIKLAQTPVSDLTHVPEPGGLATAPGSPAASASWTVPSVVSPSPVLPAEPGSHPGTPEPVAQPVGPPVQDAPSSASACMTILPA
ncbi:MAG TPA: hypothetical protein VM097_04145 [Mycobacteriales bacterium]|nr:hypothetical protein [Mycobacteriales bacterium]